MSNNEHTKRVRILVVIDADGKWEASGSHSFSDHETRESLDNMTGDLGSAPWIYRWVEANIPVPVSQPDEVIAGDVIP